MVKNMLETKPSLKSIEKTLNEVQILDAAKQCDIKGGCSNCEDNRRPPRVSGNGRGWWN